MIFDFIYLYIFFSKGGMVKEIVKYDHLLFFFLKVLEAFHTATVLGKNGKGERKRFRGVS